MRQKCGDGNRAVFVACYLMMVQASGLHHGDALGFGGEEGEGGVAGAEGLGFGVGHDGEGGGEAVG